MNKEDMEKSLERIELQSKALWWDTLLGFCLLPLIFMSVFAAFIENLYITVWGIVLIIITFCVIQICEDVQKRNIRRLYKKCQ